MSIVTDKPLIPKVKKSISIQIEDKDQQKIIEEKEKEIRKLQIKIEKLETQSIQFQQKNKSIKGQNDQAAFLKEKMAQQIQINERLMENFQGAILRLQEIINLLTVQLNISFGETDIKGFLQGLNRDNSLYSSTSGADIALTEEDKLENEFENKISQLQLKANHLKRTMIQLSSNNIKLQNKFQELKAQKLKAQTTHRKQLMEEKDKNAHFKELLSQSQSDKRNLMNSIVSMTMGEAENQLSEMNKPELISLINKLFYRIRDLQTEKTAFVKNFSKQKQESLTKYTKLLYDVKEARQKNRLHASNF